MVRKSPVHGYGAFAAKKIRKGTRVAEYLGERISDDEATRRYNDSGDKPHVLLFSIEDDVVLDAAVGGSDAQYINHSCDPNCESEIIDGRAFIIALRSIKEGEELNYDYHLDYDGKQTKEVKAKFACRCGAPNCRGTMLEPPPEKKRGKKGKKKSSGKAGKKKQSRKKG
ncbi:SET domain-containing protein-lysine N-methyltransferase [bacterium]|nr:SET domain-containing protein-lysine N-methyltransferase [bacterium]